MAVPAYLEGASTIASMARPSYALIIVTESKGELLMNGQTWIKIAAVAAVCLSLPGCSEDKDEEALAQELYMEASKHMQSARVQTEPTAALHSYNDARVLVDRLLNNYPSSTVAASLTTNQLGIGGMHLEKFRLAATALEELAAADTCPLHCAFVVVRDVSTLGDRHRALMEIAKVARGLNRVPLSNVVLVWAHERAHFDLTGNDRIEALAEIAVGFAQGGDTTKAGVALEEILADLSSPRADESDDDVLAKVAAAFAECGREEVSRELLPKVRDTSSRCDIYIALANTAAGKGDLKAARSYVDDALTIAEDIGFSLTRCFSLCSIAGSVLQISGKDKALALVGEAEACAIRSSGGLAALGLTQIADVLFDCGEKEEAVGQLRRALRFANQDKIVPAMLDFTREDVVRGLARAGRVQEAVELTSLITDQYAHAGALAALADAYRKTGSCDLAHEALESALLKAAASSEPFHCAMSLVEVGEARGNGECEVSADERELLRTMARRSSWASWLWQ